MKKQSIVFYPMTETPEPDFNDSSFSVTVLVFSEQSDYIELGYYDYEDGFWCHFGSYSFLLKCWCYLPKPEGIKMLDNKHWPLIQHQGYKKAMIAELRIKINN